MSRPSGKLELLAKVLEDDLNEYGGENAPFTMIFALLVFLICKAIPLVLPFVRAFFNTMQIIPPQYFFVLAGFGLMWKIAGFADKFSERSNVRRIKKVKVGGRKRYRQVKRFPMAG